MGDHGPGSRLVWDHPESSDLRERFSTLVAIRLPEANQARLDDNITTVNVLRFVFSHCLAVSLPPLPSHLYFSHYGTPYHFLPLSEAGGRPHVDLTTAAPKKS